MQRLLGYSFPTTTPTTPPGEAAAAVELAPTLELLDDVMKRFWESFSRGSEDHMRALEAGVVLM